MSSTTEDLVYFSVRLNGWITDSGKPVCQDHMAVIPCPYCKQLKRSE